VLFADTFYETNGAANVIRRLNDFAAEHGYPFLCIRAGEKTRRDSAAKCQFLELKRSKCSLPVDGELKFDPLLWRYKNLVAETLDDFAPDIIHLTGLNDISQLGFYFAHFRRIPAVASWHTNTHEYAARRFLKLLPGFTPAKLKNSMNCAIEKTVFRGLMKLYFLAQMQLAPNEELVEQIQKFTRRPTFLMSRGVDTDFFAPSKRRRAKDSENVFVLGYVGRLRPEKNVRLLAEIDRALQAENEKNYKFVIVGEGDESSWLKKNLTRAELTGVLRGEALAQAYADMDLLVFPSLTDAFGNVVLEAMASGVPAVVMPQGGPKFLIEQKRSGFIASDESDFISQIVSIVKNRNLSAEIREAARIAACSRSWQSVFEQVYKNYRDAARFDKNIRAETVSVA